MRKNFGKISEYLKGFDNALLLSVGLYIVLSSLLLPYYLYLINPDGISYISIAHKYMAYDFRNAVNGYWGPLFSWLLIPFLFLGFAPLLSAKLLSLLIGMVTLLGIDSLAKKLCITGSLRSALLFLVVPGIIYFAIEVITPDLLLVCLTIAYLSNILGASYAEGKYAGVISGILGAAIYFSKSYGFPFFIAHFVVINLFFIFRAEVRHDKFNILKKFIAGLVVFFIISGSWIYIISNKYNKVTIGTAGAYNHVFMVLQSKGHPIHYQGLLDPPNDTAISAWEDPTYLTTANWKTIDSWSSAKRQSRIVLKNVERIFDALNSFSILSFVILIAAVFYFVKRRKQILFENTFYLFISMAIMTAGYAPLLVVRRYLYLDYLLTILIGTYFLGLLSQKKLLKRKAGMLLWAILAISFLILPVKALYMNLGADKVFYDFSNELKRYNISGRVASNREWRRSLYLSFYNNWRYFGERGELSEAEIEDELKKKKIDYYFAWGMDGDYLDNYTEITGGRYYGLRIYRLP